MRRFLVVLLASFMLSVPIVVSAENNKAYTGSDDGGFDTSNNSGIYAALGDSIAAGAGLSGSEACHRSSQAYPHMVAQELNLTLIHAACGGATAGDLFTQQGVQGPNIPPQLNAAFASGTPELITITAGANDVGWIYFLQLCVSSDCDTDTSTATVKALLTALEVKLHFLFQEIERRSNGDPPRVVMTGYYNPISNMCKNRQSYVSNVEIEWLNVRRDELNRTIRGVVNDYSFAKYASINFNRHTICSSDPWQQGFNEPAPLHPNARGQQHIADSVLRAARR